MAKPLSKEARKFNQGSTATAVLSDYGAVPVDRVAARVLAKGIHWTPDINFGRVHSENAIPTHAAPPSRALVSVGMRFGRFVVAGYVETHPKRGTLWSCRCSCGAYEIRRSKTIRNSQGDACCSKCEYLEAIKRRGRSCSAEDRA